MSSPDEKLTELRDDLYERERRYYHASKRQKDLGAFAHASYYADVQQHLGDAANSVDAALNTLKEMDE